MHPPRFLSSQRLLDWPECSLELHCCKGSSHWPTRLLAENHGNITFAELIARLRCSKCRRFKPAPVYLCAGHRRDVGGAAPDWAIELVGEPRRN